MRVWDLPVEKLCNKHLLGQHREIHAIYSMITENKGGSYQKHPEVLRFKENLKALVWHHNNTVIEMVKRDMNHKSCIEYPIPFRPGYLEKWQSVEQQLEILRLKGCKCEI